MLINSTRTTVTQWTSNTLFPRLGTIVFFLFNFKTLVKENQNIGSLVGGLKPVLWEDNYNCTPKGKPSWAQSWNSSESILWNCFFVHVLRFYEFKFTALFFIVYITFNCIYQTRNYKKLQKFYWKYIDTLRYCKVNTFQWQH